MNLVREHDQESFRSEWTPARIFLAISSVYHLPLGILGLVLDQSFPLSFDAAEHGSSEHVFGVFETNGWHSLAALLLGVISLYFVARPRRAREVALAIGLGHVGVVLALALFDPSVFLLASNAADQVIHSATALGGTVSGLLTHDRLSVRETALPG